MKVPSRTFKIWIFMSTCGALIRMEPLSGLISATTCIAAQHVHWTPLQETGRLKKRATGAPDFGRIEIAQQNTQQGHWSPRGQPLKRSEAYKRRGLWWGQNVFGGHEPGPKPDFHDECVAPSKESVGFQDHKRSRHEYCRIIVWDNSCQSGRCLQRTGRFASSRQDGNCCNIHGSPCKSKVCFTTTSQPSRRTTRRTAGKVSRQTVGPKELLQLTSPALGTPWEAKSAWICFYMPLPKRAWSIFLRKSNLKSKACWI